MFVSIFVIQLLTLCNIIIACKYVSLECLHQITPFTLIALSSFLIKIINDEQQQAMLCCNKPPHFTTLLTSADNYIILLVSLSHLLLYYTCFLFSSSLITSLLSLPHTIAIIISLFLHKKVLQAYASVCSSYSIRYFYRQFLWLLCFFPYFPFYFPSWTSLAFFF